MSPRLNPHQGISPEEVRREWRRQTVGAQGVVVHAQDLVVIEGRRIAEIWHRYWVKTRNEQGNWSPWKVRRVPAPQAVPLIRTLQSRGGWRQQPGYE